jgi:hypothetical protein
MKMTDITGIIDPSTLLRSTRDAITAKSVEAIMRQLPIVGENAYTFNARNPSDTWQEGKLHWYPVGGKRGNAGNIKLGETPEPPIGERLINGMEAIIELERRLELLKDPTIPSPQSPREGAMRYFDLPSLDLIPEWPSLIRGKKPVDYTAELSYRLKLRLLREEGRTKDYAIVIEDDGIGQTAARMHETILSLGDSEKPDKPYLIGVFGQGGSSAFDASAYSWLMSRRAPQLPDSQGGGVGWTIVKHIFPFGRRDDYFAYLAAHPDGRVPMLPESAADAIEMPRGTRVGHIGYKFAKADMAINLFWAINHLLFNPVLPYRLYSKKDRSKSDIVRGNGFRLSKLKLREEKDLDKRFDPQEISK